MLFMHSNLFPAFMLFNTMFERYRDIRLFVTYLWAHSLGMNSLVLCSAVWHESEEVMQLRQRQIILLSYHLIDHLKICSFVPVRDAMVLTFRCVMPPAPCLLPRPSLLSLLCHRFLLYLNSATSQLPNDGVTTTPLVLSPCHHHRALIAHLYLSLPPTP